MFLAGHFLADGVSFAVIANEFLTLLSSDMNEEDLSNLVQSEIDARVLLGVSQEIYMGRGGGDVTSED